MLGNVGTLISFRLGVSDAQLLEHEFSPEFSALDLMRLPNYHIYLELMVEGMMSPPFSAPDDTIIQLTISDRIQMENSQE